MLASVSALDRNRLAAVFARDGIVRIGNFLPEGAASELHTHLRNCSDWLRIFNSGDKLYELGRVAFSQLPDAKRAELDDAIYAGARSGFQYRYETMRVPDSREMRESSNDPLAGVAQSMSAAPALDVFRDITGAADIEYADLQATAYSPGDFLTGHDDSFEGKNRRAAFVLSLTPVWRLEWGGLLIMHGGRDAPARAYLPGMNVMTIFTIGQMHSVSEVTRAAANRRYSLTGLLRAEPQPK
jgi:SM-20-related protein